MSYQLVFDIKASKEFSNSFDWYEDQQEGLGNRFEKAVYEKLNDIQQYPERYPQKRKPYREIKVKKFPFLIVYKFYKLKNTILIISIFHTSRNPKHKYTG